MNKSERTVLIVLAVLLLLGLLVWKIIPGQKMAARTGEPIIPSSATLAGTGTTVLKSSMPVLSPDVAPKGTLTATLKPHSAPAAKPRAATTSATGAPVPPKLELHKELIPKNIEIIRCYYSQEVTPPGKTFGFDINGSGFTSEFEKMIKVDAGHENVRVKNLHLITANQIHGDLEVGEDAKTSFVYPRVLIHGLPVFSAPEPFAVVRKGEVLTVFFISMEENGRGGRFRVITHLDESLAKTFQITPSTPGIQMTDLQMQLPYVVEGHLQIGPGVPPGEHGLTISIQGKEAFRRMGMIRIVRPNIGQTGFVQGLMAQDKYHRPGDEIQIYVQGTGLSPQDSASLDAKVVEFDMGKSTFTYLSPLQLRLTLKSPPTTPAGSYTVRILSNKGETLFEKNDLFKIVPANWVAGVQVSPPAKAGSKSVLKILGRDFSDDFVAAFKVETDEPRITVTGLRKVDASTLAADIAVEAGVAPGDYWMHLSSQGQKITPPFGSIIKVEAAQ